MEANSTFAVRRPTIVRGVRRFDTGADRLITECGPILIVDEDEGFRAFASHLFERAGFATEQAVSGDDAMAAVRRAGPCLVLLDVLLPDVSGFEIASELRDEFGDDLPIIFISGERTQPLDRAAGLLVGGDDYVVKPADPDELLARVRRLISRSRRGRAASGPRAPMDAELTGREREVLELLANGMRPKQIARELVISPKTVASHLQSVLGKLGVHSRAEAIAIAYREGFVGPLDSGDSRLHEGEVGSGGKAIASASSRTSESNGAAT
jgi:DNA-binding NarL/FixJ family response regulator